MAGIIAILVIKDKILWSHIKQLSHKINNTNYSIDYFDYIGKMVVDLGHKKGCINDDSSLK